MPGDAREVLTRWFARNRGAMVTPLDEARAANVLDALAAAGFHIVSEGQAVVDGEVVRLERGFIRAWDSFLGAPVAEFDPDSDGDYFRVVEAPDAR